MSEKRIALLNAYNTLNYGSMMLCENTIHYLSKLIPNVRFVVLSRFIEETSSRLRSATRYENIEVRPQAVSSRIGRVSNRLSFIVDKVILRYRNLGKQLKDCNILLVLGGDDLSEYYGIVKLMDTLLGMRYLEKTNKKIYLLGQSIGPFYSWRIPVAKNVLGKVDKIYHRGWRSYNYVTQVLRVENNSFFSSDLAFLDLAQQNETYDIEKYNIKADRYITFVPSGLWWKYSDSYETYFEALMTITRYLVQKCEELDMKVVLLPHVLRWTDDGRFVKEMVSQLGNNRIVGINDVLLPFQARAILGSSYFVVTQRMHGAISSLQRGVPAICFSYSVKFSEVVGSYLGLPELVVEIRKDHFREDIDKGSAYIDSALENQTILKSKIEKVVDKAKKEAMTQIQDLAYDMLKRGIR